PTKTLPDTSIYCFPFFSSSTTFIPFVSSISLSPLLHLSNHLKIVYFCPFFTTFNFLHHLSVPSPGVVSKTPLSILFTIFPFSLHPLPLSFLSLLFLFLLFIIYLII